VGLFCDENKSFVLKGTSDPLFASQPETALRKNRLRLNLESLVTRLQPTTDPSRPKFAFLRRGEGFVNRGAIVNETEHGLAGTNVPTTTAAQLCQSFVRFDPLLPSQSTTARSSLRSNTGGGGAVSSDTTSTGADPASRRLNIDRLRQRIRERAEQRLVQRYDSTSSVDEQDTLCNGSILERSLAGKPQTKKYNSVKRGRSLCMTMDAHGRILSPEVGNDNDVEESPLHSVDNDATTHDDAADQYYSSHDEHAQRDKLDAVDSAFATTSNYSTHDDCSQFLSPHDEHAEHLPPMTVVAGESGDSAILSAGSYTTHPSSTTDSPTDQPSTLAGADDGDDLPSTSTAHLSTCLIDTSPSRHATVVTKCATKTLAHQSFSTTIIWQTFDDVDPFMMGENVSFDDSRRVGAIGTWPSPASNEHIIPTKRQPIREMFPVIGSSANSVSPTVFHSPLPRFGDEHIVDMTKVRPLDNLYHMLDELDRRAVDENEDDILNVIVDTDGTTNITLLSPSRTPPPMSTPLTTFERHLYTLDLSNEVFERPQSTTTATSLAHRSPLLLDNKAYSLDLSWNNERVDVSPRRTQSMPDLRLAAPNMNEVALWLLHERDSLQRSMQELLVFNEEQMKFAEDMNRRHKKETADIDDDDEEQASTSDYADLDNDYSQSDRCASPPGKSINVDHRRLSVSWGDLDHGRPLETGPTLHLTPLLRPTALPTGGNSPLKPIIKSPRHDSRKRNIICVETQTDSTYVTPPASEPTSPASTASLGTYTRYAGRQLYNDLRMLIVERDRLVDSMNQCASTARLEPHMSPACADSQRRLRRTLQRAYSTVETRVSEVLWRLSELPAAFAGLERHERHWILSLTQRSPIVDVALTPPHTSMKQSKQDELLCCCACRHNDYDLDRLERDLHSFRRRLIDVHRAAWPHHTTTGVVGK
jgi:hypothetical protein